MTNPGTAIYNLLKDDAGVGAIIGDKIYPGIIPDNVAYPAVRYTELTQRFDETKDGPIATGEHSFEVHIYSYEYAQAHRLATAIKTALDWYNGTVNNVAIERIRLVDQSDDPFQDEKELFQITQEYNIRVGS